MPPNAACRGGSLGTMPLGLGPLGLATLGGLFDALVVDATTIDVNTTPQPVALLGLPGAWTVSPTGLGAAVSVVGVVNLSGGTSGILWRLTVAPELTPGAEYQISVAAFPDTIKTASRCWWRYR